MGKIENIEITTSGVLSLLPPYPIVLVTTRTNVITINQVAYFTFSPLRLGVAVAHSRYTYGRILEEQAFVINVPNRQLVDAVKQCGTLSGRDGDKFARVGLQTTSATTVKAVRVAACGAFIECQVDQTLIFEHRTWFIAKVTAAFMRQGHTGNEALMCGRHDYRIPGDLVSPR
ncbi:MAG: flavin reductase family protein [Anaerolineae bacterium]|nr:flavin reductase family protein [Anaerolineae bacterium]